MPTNCLHSGGQAGGTGTPGAPLFQIELDSDSDSVATGFERSTNRAVSSGRREQHGHYRGGQREREREEARERGGQGERGRETGGWGGAENE